MLIGAIRVKIKSVCKNTFIVFQKTTLEGLLITNFVFVDFCRCFYKKLLFLHIKSQRFIKSLRFSEKKKQFVFKKIPPWVRKKLLLLRMTLR